MRFSISCLDNLYVAHKGCLIFKSNQIRGKIILIVVGGGGVGGIYPGLLVSFFIWYCSKNRRWVISSKSAPPRQLDTFFSIAKKNTIYLGAFFEYLSL